MLSTQWKLGFHGMIKFRLVPSSRVVTGLTVVTVAAAMLILAAMAGDTFRIQITLMEIAAMA
jgi:hypothetical protein